MNNFKLKAKAAIFAGVTLVTSTGFCACGKDENIEDYNNSSLSEVSVSDSSLVDDITTDVTIDENSKSYVTDTDCEISYVDAGVTTDNNTDVVGSKSSSVNGVTTARSIGDNGVVTTKKTTDNDTVKKGSTTKTTITTKKTTPTTTKKTTTTTKVTTTTKATTVTQPPVYDFDIHNIGNSVKVFNFFSERLVYDMEVGYPDGSLYRFDFGYGATPLGNEANFMLESLNPNDCNKYFINASGLYDGVSTQKLSNYKSFMYMFKDVQEILGCDVDYSRYTIDSEIGNFLNAADDAYRNGNFDQFMNYYIVNGNASQNCLNNPGLMAILYSYDEGKYLDYNSIDQQLDVVANGISVDVLGYGYTK